MAKKEKKTKLKTVQSTQSFSPIRDIKDGIIVTKEGRFVKLMEFSPINFGLRSAGEQEAIISQYAGVIRTMPRVVHFKITSRRANVDNFVKRIHDCIDAETNDKCKKLQREQIDLIRSVSSVQGVSRRFFLSFNYYPESTMKKSPTFDKIVADLNWQGKSIASALMACGNEQLSVDGDDEYLLSVLHSIMSRNENERFGFEEREASVIARYVKTVGNDTSSIISVNNFIAPSRINAKESPNYIVVDDLYYTFCYLPSTSYPVRAIGGWLQLLINLGEGIDVDFWFEKEDPGSIQTKLQYKLRFNKVKAKDTEDTSQDYDDLMTAIESGYYLKQAMSSGDEFCYMSTILTIIARSESELQYKLDEVKKRCLMNDMKIKRCTFQMLDMFKITLPLGDYDANVFKKSRRNIMASQLASSYPFTSYEMTDEDGILIGVNSSNGSPVFVDIFDTKKYTNANMAILGSSGSGKTYFLECMALRLREKLIQVFIIAPLKGFEFERACNAIGGQFIRIAPGSPYNINIMEIRKKDDSANEVIEGTASAGSLLAAKILQLHAFFSLLVPGITQEEKQALDEALIKTYANFGITNKNRSLIDPDNPEKYRVMPVLGDLYDELIKLPESKRLYSALSRYVSGSASSFNQHTNVNLDNKYVVLDVSTLTAEMLPVGMFIALDYVWDKARENRTKKKVIFVDEAWRLIGQGSTSQAADFVLEIFKVIRGYGGSAIAATQDLNDFFGLDGGTYGSGIINNAKIKILMKTEPKEAETVARVMDLSDSETKEIKKIRRGTCLLAANQNHVFIDVQASKSEHELITTDRKDLQKIIEDKQIEEAQSSDGSGSAGKEEDK